MPNNKALQFALRKLARRSMHSFRLLAQLKEEGYTPEECEEVIAYAKQYGFLNDADYVAHFVAMWKQAGKSRHEILAKARIQHIPVSQVALLIADEREALKTVITKRYSVLLDENGDRQKKQKAIMALKRKGFSYNTILEIINNYDV